MDRKTYVTLTGAIFLVVAIVHAARLALGWEISVDAWSIPVWASWAGLVIAGFLAYTSWQISKK